MANSDFTQKKTAAGGFEAGSYREAAPAESAVALTPMQQKLAELENALPAALCRQSAAAALCLVVMLASFLGFGGAKLRGRYSEAKSWYTVGVKADNGYNLNEELTTRENTAANILTTGANTLGADSAEVQAARAALDAFSTCKAQVDSGKGSMSELYRANETLGAAVDQLYAKLQEKAADPMKMGAVQGQYGQFNSAGTIVGALHYNEAVMEYEKETGGFPASVLKGLAGVKEVEPFA
ncbi:MAG: LemA [Faecalibacterium sp.]